ncbi:MAG TPA: hypothetical protein VLF59_03585 [Candidatus Saccharimonadales bacterium]|nr:hypothetical protein [Candidatus Saccharimonadales bacterium]
MDEQKQKIIDRIGQAQNVLVTVSKNPSVDQLSAAIGLTLVLNHLDKHGTAVFSGQAPDTIEFLKPEETLEKNTDSLRDFIIALDKSKADKLRYKVEDEVVRIFITPYKTSLSEKDLEFSQGDFNVDVVLCLGVNEQEDLDAAITAHGRILHDATVVCVSTTGQGSLGSINWVDPQASSLCEMMVGLSDGLDKKALNNQIATALLTGIVASTERFRNDKTTPKTMSIAAELMQAGANQQLVATELEQAVQIQQAPARPERADQDDKASQPASPAPHEPGTLQITHEDEEEEPEPAEQEPPKPEEPEPSQIHVDENGQLLMGEPLPPPPKIPEISHVRGVDSDGQPIEADQAEHTSVHRQLMTNAPNLPQSGLTANAAPEQYDLPTEELTLPAIDSPLLTHNESVLPPAPPVPPMPSTVANPVMPAPTAPAAPTPAPFVPPTFTPAPPAVTMPVPQAPASPVPPAPVPFIDAAEQTNDTQTLREIEQSVHSPHLGSAAPQPAGSNVDDARSAVAAAFGQADNPLQPIAALNAQPLGTDLHPDASQSTAPSAPPAQMAYVPPANLFSPTPAAAAAPTVANTGFSEPTPGNTPADDALDMPLPAAQQSFNQPLITPTVPGGMGNAAPSSFPGTPPQGGMNMGGQTPPPPVPPPMFPMQ